MEEPPGSEKFIFNSTLFIMNTANNSDVSCTSGIVGEDDDVVNTTTIVLSGTYYYSGFIDHISVCTYTFHVCMKVLQPLHLMY